MLITLAMGLPFVVLALAVDMLFGEVKALRAAIAAQRAARTPEAEMIIEIDNHCPGRNLKCCDGCQRKGSKSSGCSSVW